MKNNTSKNIPEDLGPVIDYSNAESTPVPPEDLTDIIEDVSDDTEPETPEYKVDIELPVARHKRRSIIGRLLILTLLALALIWLCREIHGIVLNAFKVHWVYGFTSSLFLLLLIVLLSVVVIREIRGYLRLASFEDLRNCVEKLEVNPRDSHVNAHVRSEFQRFLQYLEAVGDGSIQSDIRDIRERMDLAEDAREWKNHLERFLLERLDEEVHQIIQKEAIKVAVGTAVSPKGFIDALISLWRNVVLVRKIAEVYRVRAGVYGTLLLVKRSFVAAAVAMLVQEAATRLGSIIGHWFFRVLSPLVQGGANAIMTIRVGIEAQKLCRPVALPKDKERKVLNMALGAIGGTLRGLRKKETKGDEKEAESNEDND